MTSTERARTRRRRRVVAAVALIASSTIACDTAPQPSAPPTTAGKLDDSDFGKLWHATAQTAPTPIPKKAPRPKERRRLRRTPVRVNGVPAVWLRLVQCEASGDWRYGGPGGHTDPGYAEYEGGPNYTRQTWLAYRLPGYPLHAYDATPLQQITVAKRVLRDQGPVAWPVCSKRVGLTMADAA